jgi:hypothetical protein
MIRRYIIWRNNHASTNDSARSLAGQTWLDAALDTEIIKGANQMESASRTGPVHYRTAAAGGVSVFYREAGRTAGPSCSCCTASPPPRACSAT